MTVTHATFTIERTFPAKPAKVFAAFADPDKKAKWFAGPPEWGPDERRMDFREGGTEYSSGGPNDQPPHVFEADYIDIVPDERIVYSYSMRIGDTRISASLTTIQLETVGGETRLTLTEQGAYLDGWDDVADREHGTGELLNSLGAFLTQ